MAPLRRDRRRPTPASLGIHSRRDETVSRRALAAWRARTRDPRMAVRFVRGFGEARCKANEVLGILRDLWGKTWCITQIDFADALGKLELLDPGHEADWGELTPKHIGTAAMRQSALSSEGLQAVGIFHASLTEGCKYSGPHSTPLAHRRLAGKLLRLDVQDVDGNKDAEGLGVRSKDSPGFARAGEALPKPCWSPHNDGALPPLMSTPQRATLEGHGRMEQGDPQVDELAAMGCEARKRPQAAPMTRASARL